MFGVLTVILVLNAKTRNFKIFEHFILQVHRMLMNHYSGSPSVRDTLIHVQT
jgi:hypothetical protein